MSSKHEIKYRLEQKLGMPIRDDKEARKLIIAQKIMFLDLQRDYEKAAENIGDALQTLDEFLEIVKNAKGKDE